MLVGALGTESLRREVAWADHQRQKRPDVLRAIHQTVFTDDPSLSFGVQKWPHTDDQPVTRTLTYRNTGTTPVTLDLSATTTGPDGQCANVTYDPTYHQLPIATAVFTHGCWGAAITSSVEYDRGLEVATNSTDTSASGTITFSAWMASYTDPERPYVTVQFFDSTTTAIGGLVALDRASSTYFTTFADGTTTFDQTTHEGNWAKYVANGSVPPGARSAVVGVTRSPNAGLAGRPDTYTDLVKLDVQAVAFVPPSVVSTAPGGTTVRPDATVKVALQDGTTQVNPGNLQFSFDGTPVTPSVSRVGAVTTIEYDPPGLLPAASAHAVRLVFQDNGIVPTTQTNQFSFSVLSYYNILLPSPIHFEDFNSTVEGSLPDGWTQQTFSVVPDPNIDFGDLNSAAYAGWTVVNSARFNDPLLTYGAHTPETDYRRVLSTNPANVVNGAIVEQLAQDKIAFGDSGYRDGDNQVMYLFSKDFDLTGRNNVYLVFNSIWEQNQDSIGAVEYSVDEGATWLPLAYYLDGADVLRDGSGAIDPVATFSTMYTSDPNQRVATYTDPDTQEVRGGYYGAFIGVDSNRWSTLAPFISPRLDDNPAESKRVEIFRLPAADNQAKVRLRFAHAGTDSWYFGLDNVGLYSLTEVSPPVITGLAPVTDAVGNTVNFGVSLLGVGPYTFQWRRNDVDLPGQTAQSLSLSNIQLSTAGDFSVRVGYLGGSVISAPATLTVFQSDPSPVTLQWDFNNSEDTATCGANVDYFDASVFAGSYILDTDIALLPPIEDVVTIIMHVPGSINGQPSGGYKLRHGLAANGGGTNVNQYTLILDLLYPATSQNLRRALLQTQTENTDDAEFRFDESNVLGVNGVYQGRILPDTWHRVALAVDLSGPGPNPVVAKFIDGVKVGQQVLPAGRDGRWSLSTRPDAPYALLFAGLATEVQEGFVSSVQFRSGRLSDAAIAAMGGPSAGKIPGAVCAMSMAGSPVIRWSGGELLQADSINGPWTPVTGAAKPYPVATPLGGMKFYRSR